MTNIITLFHVCKGQPPPPPPSERFPRASQEQKLGECLFSLWTREPLCYDIYYSKTLLCPDWGSVQILAQQRKYFNRIAVRRRRLATGRQEEFHLQLRLQHQHVVSRHARWGRWYSITMLPSRSCREYPRSSDWWQNFVMSGWNEARWIKYF